MRVAVAYDHRGRKGVKCVRTVIEQQGHELIDLGPKRKDKSDCPDYAYLAGIAVVQKEVDTAILLCTTGIGMSMSANKVRGVRAARCHDEFDARAARVNFNANVLCLSGELLGENDLRRIVEAWLNTDYKERTRSERLITKIQAIETGDDPRDIAGSND